MGVRVSLPFSGVVGVTGLGAASLNRGNDNDSTLGLNFVYALTGPDGLNLNLRPPGLNENLAGSVIYIKNLLDEIVITLSETDDEVGDGATDTFTLAFIPDAGSVTTSLDNTLFPFIDNGDGTITFTTPPPVGAFTVSYTYQGTDGTTETVTFDPGTVPVDGNTGFIPFTNTRNQTFSFFYINEEIGWLMRM